MDCRSRSDYILSTVKRLRHLKSLTNSLKRSIKCLIPITIKPFFNFNVERECQYFTTPEPNDSKTCMEEPAPLIPVTVRPFFDTDFQDEFSTITSEIHEDETSVEHEENVVLLLDPKRDVQDTEFKFQEYKDASLSDGKYNCINARQERKLNTDVDISFIPVTVESLWDFPFELENEIQTSQTNEVKNTFIELQNNQIPISEWNIIDSATQENNNVINIQQSDKPEIISDANTPFTPITITPFFDLSIEVGTLKEFYEITPKEFLEPNMSNPQQTEILQNGQWYEFKNDKKRWTNDTIQFNPMKEESKWDIKKSPSDWTEYVSAGTFNTISTLENPYNSNDEEKYTIKFNYETSFEISNLTTDKDDLSTFNSSLKLSPLDTLISDSIEKSNNVMGAENQSPKHLKQTSHIPTTQQTKKSRKSASSIEKRKSRQLHNIQKHVISDTCSCKKKCSTFLSDETREKINKHYWCSSTEDQRATFVKDLVTISNVKRRRSKKTDESRRNNSFKFFLPKLVEFEFSVTDLVEVCKCFFLSTLGYKKNNDSVLRKLRTTYQLSST